MPTAVRLLLVEDDDDLRLYLTIILEDEGFEVVTASSGKEGLLAVSRDAPDLVLLDLMMPGLNEGETLVEIRKTSSVPVIVVGGLAHEAGRLWAVPLGADDYLAKPFSTRELVARVDAVLRRAKATAGEGP